MLGPPPPMDTKHQRGITLRAHSRYMGLDFDQWPEEAQDVEMAEVRERLKRECRPTFYDPGTPWSTFCEWIGSPFR